jgi:hypothetical protein
MVYDQNYHNCSTLYGLPHGNLHVFNTILYENEFQNPQIFQQTISLFPEQSTLVVVVFGFFSGWEEFIDQTRSSVARSNFLKLHLPSTVLYCLLRHRKDIYQRIFISYPISKIIVKKVYFLSFFGAGYFEDIIS